MSLTNYFNPETYKPGAQLDLLTGSGYDQQMDRTRFGEMANLQKALAMLDIMQKTETQTQGYDARQAERGRDVSKFDLERMISGNAQQMTDYAGAMNRGKMGEAQFNEARGREAIGTVDSTIKKTNTGNEAAVFENEARKLEIMASNSPLELNMEYQKFLSGVPQQFKHAFPQQYNATVPQTLRRIQDAVRDNPAHRRATDLEDVKGFWDLAKQRESNEGSLATARVRGAQKFKDYDQSLKEAKSSAHIMSIATQIQSDPEIPADKQASLLARAKAAFNAMAQLEASRADSRNPAISDVIGEPGAVGNRVRDRLSGDGTDPRPTQQYTIGQTYRGKTGAYKYKGGNPKDPKSWDKVQ